MSLEGYSDEAQLKSYIDMMKDPDNPATLTRYFTLYSLLPDLKDKILLDLPCGLGHEARKFVLQGGAKKVFAVDLVQKQVEMAKKEDPAAGIKPGQIEYAVHDARQPKVLANPLVDLCISIHLFCNAQDYPSLVEMCRCVYLNSKPGGVCYSTNCSLSRDDQLVKKFDSFCEIHHIDPWQGDIYKPRRFHHTYGGFYLDVFLWEYDAIKKALQEAGFSKVERHPFQEDPSYTGSVDIKLFSSATQGSIVIVYK